MWTGCSLALVSQLRFVFQLELNSATPFFWILRSCVLHCHEVLISDRNSRSILVLFVRHSFTSQSRPLSDNRNRRFVRQFMPWVEHFLSPRSDMTNQLQLCFIYFPHVPAVSIIPYSLGCCNQAPIWNKWSIDPSCMSDTPRSSSDPSRFSIWVIDSGKQLAAILAASATA